MSDPWLKVWAADMRGDPDIALLGLDAQMLLVHAWDIARDESTTYGELRRRDGSPYTAATFSAVVPGAKTPAVRSWWKRILELEFAEQTSDGALYFPKLEERQRGSSGAVRQARYRARNDERKRDARRNDPRHATRNRVTGRVTPTETAELEPEPEPERDPSVGVPIDAHSEGQSLVVAPEIDHQIRNGSGLTEATQAAILELVERLPDATDGTVGRLVKLAKRGAGPAAFHDARQGVAATQSRHPSRVACQIVQEHVDGKR